MTEETGFDALMTFTCVEMGFCGSIKNNQTLHVNHFIPNYGTVTADQFVEWVFLADSLNPNEKSERLQRYKNQLKAAFIKHMGAEVIDATELKYPLDDKDLNTVLQIEKCQDEFHSVNPQVNISKLVSMDKGVFYPVNQIIQRKVQQYSDISVCWFNHDAYWLDTDESRNNFIIMIFHHNLDSSISRTRFNMDRLRN